MRLAIDVGNTHTVLGFHDGSDWIQVFRVKTDPELTEDELAASVLGMLAAKGITLGALKQVGIASVVPAVNKMLQLFCSKWLGLKPFFLQADDDYGVKIAYQPRSAVGADRIANVLAALQLHQPPLVIVDFGTAATFDAVDRAGTYLGGAILPGPTAAAEALVGRTAKLPQIELDPPKSAIGRNTVDALKSGLVLGYADSVNGLAKRISGELGGAKVIVTGGQGRMFIDLCEILDEYHPNLVLDGILIALDRL